MNSLLSRKNIIDAQISDLTTTELSMVLKSLADNDPNIEYTIQDILNKNNQLDLTHKLIKELDAPARLLQSSFFQQLESLVSQGEADAVLNVAEDIVRLSQRTILEYDDAGEINDQLEDDMGVFRDALEKSSLPEVEKILFAIKIAYLDEYDLCSDLADYLEPSAHSKEVWSEVADILLETVQHYKQVNAVNNNKLILHYMNYGVNALQNSDREEDKSYFSDI